MIKCTNVWFDYDPVEHPKDDWALQGIDLSIHSGEYIAIIGPNGSGKSTLSRLLNGLLVPIHGTVSVGEYDTKQSADQWLIRQIIGIVFQNPDHQIVGTTIQDDIAFGLENLGLPVDEMKRRIRDVSRKVGLTDLDQKDPSHLSGGQKQRLAIAGVLAMQPEVLIFDESTSMLDPQGTKEVLSIIQHLHQQKKTILQVSHAIDEVLLAERILLIAEGKIQLDIRQDQLYAHLHQLEKWGLELPLHLQLYRELESRNWPIREIANRRELVNEIWRLLAKK